MSLDVEFLRRFEAPMVWGVTDCVQFAAGAIEYYGGWRPVIPVYKSEREAYRLIAQGGGLVELVKKALAPPIHLKDVQTGDVIYTTFKDTGPMLGVADPPLVFWVRREGGGFAPLELSYAIWAWPCRKQP